MEGEAAGREQSPQLRSAHCGGGESTHQEGSPNTSSQLLKLSSSQLHTPFPHPVPLRKGGVGTDRGWNPPQPTYVQCRGESNPPPKA